MVHLKSPREIDQIRASCRIAAEAMVQVRNALRPGITTSTLDDIADCYIRDQGGVPSAKGYRGYPRSICISLNEEVVHGIPSDRQITDRDILSVDIAVKKDGFHGDMNVSFAMKQANDEARRLMETTKQSMEIGLESSVAAYRLGDVGAHIQQHVEAAGFSIVREYCGHGIGRSFHEEPQLLHYGTPQTGRRLQAGMVFTIEPMVNAGEAGVRVLEDDWTAVTKDGSLSTQFEHTVAVTENGPDVLSRFDDLPF
ncbi:MAG: type I methionyl aminopeptidase [Candidatus Latescibacterota bacterium]|nr:type I methionyl aminopeptidase [Candidatus Latescibacterota bacterium]